MGQITSTDCEATHDTLCTCAAGYSSSSPEPVVSKSLTCTACEPGQFAESGKTSCKQWSISCAAGTYYTAVGTTEHDEVCTTCLGTDWYSAGTTAIVHDTFPGHCAVHVSPTCAAGTYFKKQATANADRECSACSAGTPGYYSAGTTASLAANSVTSHCTSACGTCDSDSQTQLTACADNANTVCQCKAGYKQSAPTPGPASCTPCSTGQYAAAGASSCTSCPTNSNGAARGADISACVCKSGYWSTSGHATLDSNQVQVDCAPWSNSCAAGKYYTAAGATTHDEVCTTCLGTNFFSASSTAIAHGVFPGHCATPVLSTCAAGTYFKIQALANADRECGACSAGTTGHYSAGTTASLASNTVALACTSACVACDSASQVQLVACSDNANTICQCKAGYRQSATTPGPGSCTPCALGHYSVAGQTTDCGTCPLGSYATAGDGLHPGQRSTCTACSTGQFAPAGAGFCTDCPTNSNGSPPGADITACVCKSGYWSASGHAMLGADCSPWSKQCPTAGTFYAVAGSVNSDITCTTCGANTFQASPMVVTSGGPAAACASPCTTCAGVGQTTTSTACAATHDALCTCVAGYSRPAPAVSASLTCTQCTSGHYAASGATSCAVCSAGQYAAAGASFCTDCPSHSNQAAPGADINACVCNSGYWSASGHATLGADCSPWSIQCPTAGTFYAVAGSVNSDITCTTCGANTFQAAPMLVSSGVKAACLGVCTAVGAGQRVLAACTSVANTTIASCAFNTFSALGTQSSTCPACSTCSGSLPSMLAPCSLSVDTLCGAAGTSPNPIPVQAPIAASPSAMQGSTAVPGALTLSAVSRSALADPDVLALLTSAITASVQSSLPSNAASISVAITSITDVATGVIIFGGAGAGIHRRLQQAPSGSQSAKVTYNVLLPASVPAATVLAVVSPSGANAAFFVTAVTKNIVAAAAAAANPTISSGLGSMTASLPPTTPAASAAATPSMSCASPLAAGIGGAVGGAVVTLLVVFAYRRALFAKAPKVSPAPKENPSPKQSPRVVTALPIPPPPPTLRVVTTPPPTTTQRVIPALMTETPPPRTLPPLSAPRGSRSSRKVAPMPKDSL